MTWLVSRLSDDLVSRASPLLAFCARGDWIARLARQRVYRYASCRVSTQKQYYRLLAILFPHHGV